MQTLPENTPISTEEAQALIALLRRLGNFIDPNQDYTIEEASAFLKQSRATTYRQIADQDSPLTGKKVGGRLYIPGSALLSSNRS